MGQDRRGAVDQGGLTSGAPRRGRRAALAGTAMLAAGAPSAEAQPAAALLDDTLRPYLARFGLPALASAAVRDGAIVAQGVAGTRRAGSDVPVTLGDRFHIGSDTKAMTSLLAATFVEEGKLRWDSALGEVFPELAATMDARLRGVTLTQLLSHISGIPSDNQEFGDLLTRSFALDGNPNLDELRYWLLRQWMARPLQSAPGAAFAYSNLGYTIAGAMLERVGALTWEELVVQRIFTPLGLRSAGFGPQSSMGRTDAALGHLRRDDGTAKPVLAGPNADNPAIIGPAGIVHLSLGDFATWAAWHAGDGRRGPPIVRPETVRHLHTKVIELPPLPGAPPGTPSIGGYALGWGVVNLPYASGPVLQHSGSNTMNLASIIVQPARDFAIVMLTNIGGTRADEALRALMQELYARYALR
jgi:CubicO group peptidase (beta-lactamase class C family)